MKRVTIKDVARAAKVSPSSVTNALNPNSKKVSQGKREQILKVVEELGYVPDVNAQKIASKSLRRIGFFVRPPKNFLPGHINSQLIHYMNKWATENDLDLINIIMPVEDKTYIPKLIYKIKNYRITDIIFYGLDNNSELINELSKLKINKIFIELPSSGPNNHFISTDNYQMQLELLENIFQTKKFEKMIYLAGNQKSYVAKERERAVVDFSRDNPIFLKIINSNFEEDEAYSTIEKHDLSGVDLIACGSDNMVLGVSRYLKEKKLNILLAGFDNIDSIKYVPQEVYTVEQNIDSLCQEIIKMFLKQDYRNQLIKGEIVHYKK